MPKGRTQLAHCASCGAEFLAICSEIKRGRGKFCSHKCYTASLQGPRGDDWERFESFVHHEPNTGCWLWSGYTTKRGYGRFGVTHPRRGLVYAHRYSYERLVGPVPAGTELDHTCRQPCCVNPAHLEPVTHQVNCARGWAARKDARP